MSISKYWYVWLTLNTEGRQTGDYFLRNHSSNKKFVLRNQETLIQLIFFQLLKKRLAYLNLNFSDGSLQSSCRRFLDKVALSTINHSYRFYSVIIKTIIHAASKPTTLFCGVFNAIIRKLFLYFHLIVFFFLLWDFIQNFKFLIKPHILADSSVYKTKENNNFSLQSMNHGNWKVSSLKKNRSEKIEKKQKKIKETERLCDLWIVNRLKF